MRLAGRPPSRSWSGPWIGSLAIAVACLTAAGCGVQPTSTPATGTASQPAATPAATPDEVIDGFAIGPVRDTGSPSEFHRLEVAARDAWRTGHPGQAVAAFTTHHAGRLADGTTQPGTDDPFTYLMVVNIAGGEHHALVLHCSPLTPFNLGECR